MNAMDLWQFTPLHEAASKSRVEVCSLLLAHGADPTLVNCHSKSAIDVAPTRELQERLQQEFKGHSLLEGCRQADVARVKKYLEVVNFKHPYSGDTALVRFVTFIGFFLSISFCLIFTWFIIKTISLCVKFFMNYCFILQHCAAASPFPKRKQVVEALIRKGANLNDKNKE